ncbi:hypothetical protein, partial [Raoultella ornithinolytica]|uniref:hypothetical protein n=1 Tax=Raoultella ornithinolytica TaxID=54291 RepID=UPI001D00EF97
VLGLPPAFNLSHDQTLQFKFDARELNFVMNYVFTQRLGIHFSSEDVKNPCHFECPHRLSDKLLKSSATARSALSRGGVYYAFLFQSQPHFSEVFSFNPAACLPLFRVDGGAL